MFAVTCSTAVRTQKGSTWHHELAGEIYGHCVSRFWIAESLFSLSLGYVSVGSAVSHADVSHAEDQLPKLPVCCAPCVYPPLFRKCCQLDRFDLAVYEGACSA